jgi:hypothetical protein
MEVDSSNSQPKRFEVKKVSTAACLSYSRVVADGFGCAAVERSGALGLGLVRVGDEAGIGWVRL